VVQKRREQRDKGRQVKEIVKQRKEKRRMMEAKNRDSAWSIPS
jgi:hypothetical protein